MKSDERMEWDGEKQCGKRESTRQKIWRIIKKQKKKEKFA